MKRLSRSQIYALVWSKPMTHLAKEFDISDVGLAKVCRKHDIPLPGLGHWAKVAAGKKVKTIPLPRPEDDSQIDVGERSPTLRALYAQKREWATHEKQLLATLPPIAVPEALDSPHRLTKATKKYFEDLEAKIARANARKRLPEIYASPLGQHGRYTCPASKGFDLTVSLGQLDRALLFLDTLVKALETQGFKVSNNAEGPNTHLKYVEAAKDDEGVRFSLSEGYRRRMLSPEDLKIAREKWAWASEYEMVPSGKFTFTLNGRESGTERKWIDDSKKLEARLPPILAEFSDLIPRQKQLRIDRAREKEERWQRERKAERARWTRTAQLRQLEEALSEAERLDRLQKLEAYLQQLEEKYSEVNGTGPSGNSADWFHLIRKMIEQEDPRLARVEKLVRLNERETSEIDWVPGDFPL
jgi:hypothetical protein